MMMTSEGGRKYSQIFKNSIPAWSEETNEKCWPLGQKSKPGDMESKSSTTITQLQHSALLIFINISDNQV
jgi:hypothetical protein